MRTSLISILSACLFAYSGAGHAQEATTGSVIKTYGALSIGPGGAIGWVQDESSRDDASSSALATCWNKLPAHVLLTKCVVGTASANYYLAAVWCDHKTPNGLHFARYAVGGDLTEKIAGNVAIDKLTEDGNVLPADCKVIKTIQVGADSAKPAPKTATVIGQQG